MCHAQVSHKWLYHLDACTGSVLTPQDRITNMQKRLGNRIWVGGGQCRCCGSFLEPQLEHAETCSTAEATRGHYACVHAVVCGMNLADPGITTRPRGSQKHDPDQLIISQPLLSPDAARPWTCGLLQRSGSHYRNEIGELRQQNIHYRPLVWTVDGRPHPAVTRTLQYAADIASCRNGQHLSATYPCVAGGNTKSKSLSYAEGQPWLAQSSRTLQRDQSGLSAGIIDRPLHHWRRVLALDGGPGDHDLDDFETDTATNDDDDDIVSPASCTNESV